MFITRLALMRKSDTFDRFQNDDIKDVNDSGLVMFITVTHFFVRKIRG